MRNHSEVFCETWELASWKQTLQPKNLTLIFTRDGAPPTTRTILHAGISIRRHYDGVSVDRHSRYRDIPSCSPPSPPPSIIYIHNIIRSHHYLVISVFLFVCFSKRWCCDFHCIRTGGSAIWVIPSLDGSFCLWIPHLCHQDLVCLAAWIWFARLFVPFISAVAFLGVGGKGRTLWRCHGQDHHSIQRHSCRHYRRYPASLPILCIGLAILKIDWWRVDLRQRGSCVDIWYAMHMPHYWLRSGLIKHDTVDGGSSCLWGVNNIHLWWTFNWRVGGRRRSVTSPSPPATQTLGLRDCDLPKRPERSSISYNRVISYSPGWFFCFENSWRCSCFTLSQGERFWSRE